jgi:uncharacterized protein (DUF362 family)
VKVRTQPGANPHLARREFLKRGGAVASAVALGGLSAEPAQAAPAVASLDSLIAQPPAGFAPLNLPGKVIKVDKGTDFASLMQRNLLWPKAEVARQMLERAMVELTGASNLTAALGKFIHPADTVALKVNGLGGQRGQTAAFNFELVLPVVESLIALGVPPQKITIFEQWASFLMGTRVNTPGHALPKGVKVGFHANHDATMPEIQVYQGIRTRYVRYLTEASAVIDMTMMKDHSICGFTGALKNMAYGQIVNAHDHHRHACNPQIPMLYNHPILRSRVRLHIVDAFKIIYDEGPHDKNPKRRLPHGAVYVATDPVALDTLGHQVIEQARQAHGLKSLKAVGREPGYIRTAADLGLGVHDLNAIRLRSVSL